MVGYSNMASITKCPPVFGEKDDYDQWKKDIELWKEVTDIKEEKIPIIIHLSLSGRARQATSELSVAELKGANGYELLMQKLDRVFLQDSNWKCFNTYLAFENYRRDPATPIDEYLSEFDRRHYKLKECDVELPDAIIACRLLKSCNLSEVHFQLALSTTKNMTFDDMRATLKKLFTDVGAGKTIDTADDMPSKVKLEPSDTFFGQASRRGSRGRGDFKPQRGNFRGRNMRKGNPLDYHGNVSKCFSCGSEQHWSRACPKKKHFEDDAYNFADNFYGQDEEVALVAFEVFETKVREFSTETIGHVLLDSGCSRTVCGTEWFKTFMDTLPESELHRVKTSSSNSVFRFGDGNSLKSIKSVTMPCKLAGKSVTITTEVVESNIPLLLSKESMKKAQMKLDLVDDSALVLGCKVKLINTTSGHYALPLYPVPSVSRVNEVLFASKEQDFKKIAVKLHKQFAHPSADRLKKLVTDAGKRDKKLLSAIDDISSGCETCLKYRKPSPRPVVSVKLAETFNETVSADLKV